MRMIVVSFAFHSICVLDSNRLWALCLPESVPSVSICVYLCLSMLIHALHLCHSYLTLKTKKNVFDLQPHPWYCQTHMLTAELVNMVKGC